MKCDDLDGKLLAELLEESTDEFECNFMSCQILVRFVINLFSVANTFGIVENKHLIKPVIVPMSEPGKIGAKYVLAKEPVEQCV